MMAEHARPKMLVVDDDEAIRFMVTKVLQREDFDVTVARDGQEAIEALQAAHFDGILLDLMMPRVDGFGVMQFLRERMPRLLPKVVIMTAFTSAARERLEPNCELIAKPFDLGELVTTVRRCLGIS